MSRRIGLRVAVLIASTMFAANCGHGAADNDDAPKTASPKATPARTPNGEPMVHLDPAAQARIGIRTQAATTQTIQPEIVAYGRLEEDPSRVFVLRALVAGTLHAGTRREWPRLGEAVADGAAIGAIEPRLAPAERISLTNQLAAARADLTAATSSAAAAKSAYDRARTLNADNKNVSDRAVEEAAARSAAEDAKAKTAEDTVRLLETSLRGTGSTALTPLTIDRGGEVVEMLAQPEEAVEPGTPILRVAKFDHLVARIDIPVGDQLPPTATSARIVAVGYERTPLTGTRIALAGKADPTAQGESVLFEVPTSGVAVRPGVAVTARIPVPGPQRSGFLIPSAAIVRMSGKAYVFVQTAANDFVRREVTLEPSLPEGFVATAGLRVGDRLVVQGAELLLSEELKSQLATETDKD